MGTYCFQYYEIPNFKWKDCKEMFKENGAIPEPSGFTPSSTSLSSLPVPSPSSNKSNLLNSNFEIESDPELDQSMSPIDFENLEVTDEVGEESSEEIIEIEREEGLGSPDEKSDDVEKGNEEKRNEESNKKKEESFELRKKTEEAKGNVENAEEDVWVKTVRYSDDRKSLKKNSAKKGVKKTEEEIVLIENWNNVKERERIWKKKRRLLNNYSEFVKRKERMREKNN